MPTAFQALHSLCQVLEAEVCLQPLREAGGCQDCLELQAVSSPSLPGVEAAPPGAWTGTLGPGARDCSGRRASVTAGHENRGQEVEPASGQCTASRECLREALATLLRPHSEHQTQ